MICDIGNALKHYSRTCRPPPLWPPDGLWLPREGAPPQPAAPPTTPPPWRLHPTCAYILFPHWPGACVSRGVQVHHTQLGADPGLCSPLFLGMRHGALCFHVFCHLVLSDEMASHFIFRAHEQLVKVITCPVYVLPSSKGIMCLNFGSFLIAVDLCR